MLNDREALGKVVHLQSASRMGPEADRRRSGLRWTTFPVGSHRCKPGLDSDGEVEFAKKEQDAKAKRAKCPQSSRIGDDPGNQGVHPFRCGIGDPMLEIPAFSMTSFSRRMSPRSTASFMMLLTVCQSSRIIFATLETLPQACSHMMTACASSLVWRW